MTLAALLLYFAAPANSWACACCLEGNEWNRGKAKLSESVYASAIEGLQLSGTLRENNGERGPELLGEKSFKLWGRVRGLDRLVFAAGEKEKDGRLVFSFPKEVEFFFADTRMAAKTDAAPTAIYHDLHFAGSVVAEGPLAQTFGPKPRPASLILQGTGGHCIGAGSFGKWMLRFESAAKDPKENPVQLLAVGVPKDK